MGAAGADVSQQVDIDTATGSTGPTLGAEAHICGEGTAVSRADRPSTGTTTTTHRLGKHGICCQPCGVDHHPQGARTTGAELHRATSATSAATAAFNSRGPEAVLRGRFSDACGHRTAPLAATATDGLGVETEGHHTAGADPQQAVCIGTLHDHSPGRLAIAAAAAHTHAEAAGVRLIAFGGRGRQRLR